MARGTVKGSSPVNLVSSRALEPGADTAGKVRRQLQKHMDSSPSRRLGPHLVFEVDE